MSFYDLSKQERIDLVAKISNNISSEVKSGNYKNAMLYFLDQDTYIRKSSYLIVGRLYIDKKILQSNIIGMLDTLLPQDDFRIRQTVVNAAGEIGKGNFEIVQHFFDKSLFDTHHSPRNAVIGSIKKMAEVNPVPVLNWSKNYLHHEDKEIRREICNGIELRGRKFPQD